MNVETQTMHYVDTALNSINTVIKKWGEADKKTKTHLSERIEKLEKWKIRLETWKTNFLLSEGEDKYILILDLQAMMKQFS